MVCFCPPNDQDELISKKPLDLPSLMVCVKTQQKSPNKQQKQQLKRVKRSKSRELRASILHIGCDCERRYGLQDDCPRSDCHGSPECLVKPDPICGPSEFAGGKHLMKKLERKKNATLNNSTANNNTTETYECFPVSLELGENM